MWVGKPRPHHHLRIANQCSHYYHCSHDTPLVVAELFSPEHRVERMTNLLPRPHRSRQERTDKSEGSIIRIRGLKWPQRVAHSIHWEPPWCNPLSMTVKMTDPCTAEPVSQGTTWASSSADFMQLWFALKNPESIVHQWKWSPVMSEVCGSAVRLSEMSFTGHCVHPGRSGPVA